MPELPTTAIGLIAFMMAGFGFIFKYVIEQNKRTVETFMTYIEKKNGNLERTTQHFTDKLDERDKRFDDMLIQHDNRHKEMMDDMAARLEASLPLKK